MLITTTVTGRRVVEFRARGGKCCGLLWEDGNTLQSSAHNLSQSDIRDLIAALQIWLETGRMPMEVHTDERA